MLLFRLLDWGNIGLVCDTDNFLQDDNQTIRVSALSSQICPETVFRKNVASQWESACHVPDVYPSHRCSTDDDCGIESVTCRKRTCSMAGYCGLWLVVY